MVVKLPLFPAIRADRRKTPISLCLKRFRNPSNVPDFVSIVAYATNYYHFPLIQSILYFFLLFFLLLPLLIHYCHRFRSWSRPNCTTPKPWAISHSRRCTESRIRVYVPRTTHESRFSRKSVDFDRIFECSIFERKRGDVFEIEREIRRWREWWKKRYWDQDHSSNRIDVCWISIWTRFEAIKIKSWSMIIFIRDEIFENSWIIFPFLYLQFIFLRLNHSLFANVM